MKQINIPQQQDIKELSDFIDSNPEPKEQKLPLGVRMWIERVPCSKIQKILNVSPALIAQFKRRFIENGMEELKLRCQGSKAYLSKSKRARIINYLDTN